MDSTFFDMTADLPLRLESLDMPTSAQTDAFGLVNSFCTGNPFAAWQPKSPEPYFGNNPYSPSTTPSSPASSVGTAYESETHESDPEFVADFPTPDEVLQRACPTAQEEDRLCLNCWTAETPLWRRNDNGFFLCNACGLFLKTYGKNRTPPKERRVPAKKPKALAAIEIECFNCKTTETSLWRRGENNCALCNACGLYWKIHGSDRPLKMNKKAGPRRRQRVWRAPSEKSKPYSTVPASKNNSPVATRKSSDARIAAEVPVLSTRPSSPIPKEEPASPVLSPVAASASVSPVATAVPSVALPPPLLFGAPAASLPMFPGQYSTLPTSVNTGAQLGMPLLDPSLLAQQMLLAGNPFAAMAAPTLPLNNSALTAAATTQQFLTSAAMAFSLMSMQPMAMQQLTFGMPAFGGFGMDLVQKAVENLDSQVQALKEYTRQQALMAQQQQGF